MENLWDRFNAQFENGLVSALFVSVLIVGLSWALIKLLRRALTQISSRGRFDTTHLIFLRRVINAVICVVAALVISMQIVPLKGLSKSLLASSGVVAVVIGFAAQQAMSNIVGGFFLSMFRPFAIGDRIRIMGQDVIGVVEDISLRHTVIRNFDNNRVIVPNSVMNSAIVENAQYRDGTSSRPLDIRVDSAADVERAMEIIARAAQSHPDFYDTRGEQDKADGTPAVVVRMVEFDGTSVTLRTILSARDEGVGYVMRCDLLQQIHRELQEAGIALPVARSAVQIHQEKEE